MRTHIFNNRTRLLGNTSPSAITGCGIPGSNYVEFQPGVGSLAFPGSWPTKTALEIASDVRVMGVDVQGGHAAQLQTRH